MIRELIAASILALASAPSLADSVKPAASGPEPREMAEEAMNLVAADDIDGFVALVRRKMPMPPGEIEKIENTLKTQRKDLVSKLGKSLGYLLVSECRRGDTLRRLVYAEKREKSVMRWQFIFYKPRDKWLWTFFFWDSDLAQLFVNCD